MLICPAEVTGPPHPGPKRAVVMHAFLPLGRSGLIAVPVVIEIAGLMATVIMMRTRGLRHAFVAMPVTV